MESSQIIEKILSEGQSEADKLTKEADEQQSAEQAEFDRKMDDYKSETANLAQSSAEEKKAHLLAAARMEIGKELLAEKRKVLDEVFEQAKQQLQNMNPDEYAYLMTNLMLKAVESGEEEVIVDPNEKVINAEFIEKVNGKLGSKGSLKLAADKETIGAGFILRRGRIRVNASTGVLMETARDKLEIGLAKELFG